MQDDQQNITSEHTGYFGNGLNSNPNGFGVYRDKLRQLIYIGFFKDGFPSGFGYIRDTAVSHHFYL